MEPPPNRGATSRLIAALGLLLLFACLAACGSGQNAEPAAVPTPTLEPLAAAGKTVFTSDCAPCHSLVDQTVIVGPSLVGIADVAATRVDGLDARAYLYTSILRPGDYIVEGFDHTMPETFGKKLTGEEIDSLVAYLLTLRR